MSEYYAIETEEHSRDTITHYVPYGRQIEGAYGRWTASCGRLVDGTAWQAGTVEGLRCKNCMTREAKREARTANY